MNGNEHKDDGHEKKDHDEIIPNCDANDPVTHYFFVTVGRVGGGGGGRRKGGGKEVGRRRVES